MKHTCVCGALVVCALVTFDRGGWAQGPPKEQPNEVMTVDGRKNPELIPQWSAWGYAFRVFSGGPRELPTSVLAHVTDAERALIMKEADAAQRIDATCKARHQKMLSESGSKKVAELARDVWDLTLECRWETLHARDRVLNGLTPEAQVALIAFVESTKAGTSLTIAKKDLARFREPE